MIADAPQQAGDDLEGTPDSSRRLVVLLLVGLAAALGIRVLLLPSYGFLADIDQYARWTYRLATDLPFGAAYRLDMSYMPVLVAVFGALARAVPAFAVNPDAGDVVVRAALKVPPILADVAIAVGLAVILRPRRPFAVAVVLTFLLLPATWYLSAVWAQFDAIYVAFCLWAAIAAIRDRPLATALLLGLAMMTKPQALFLAAPFAGYVIGRWGMRRAVIVGLVAAGVALLTWLPFLPYGGFGDYLANLDYYQNLKLPVLSANAWNLWWLVQEPIAGIEWLSDATPILGPFTARHLGIAVTAVGEIAVFAAVLRRPTPVNLLLGLATATLVAFCAMTSMHERYGFAALVFLLPLVGDRRILAAWIVLAVTSTLNMLAAAPPLDMEPGSFVPLTGPIGLLAAGATFGVTIGLLVLLVRGRLSDDLLPGVGTTTSMPST